MLYRPSSAQVHWLSLADCLPLPWHFIFPLCTRFLTAHDCQSVNCVARRFHSTLGDTFLFPPVPPLARRFTGCGREVPAAQTSHRSPSPFVLGHWAWDFLSVSDRKCLIVASPLFAIYARARLDSVTASLGYLRSPRSSESLLGPVSRRRAWDMTLSLIRHQFNYGDFIRSMRNLYTYQRRDWDQIWSVVEAIEHAPQIPGYPPINTDRAFRICTQGVPLAGDYSCSYDAVAARNLYNNHPTLSADGAIDLVRKKFRDEEKGSFIIAFPRWVFHFVFGVFLLPLTFVMPKHADDAGRICPDGTNQVPTAPNVFDDGAPNFFIPPPGTPNRDEENPAVYYGTAFLRALTWIFNLRIDHPSDDILQLADDISKAFHRILYLPSMMVVFAYVFEDYWCVPTGQIFGGRSTGSYYMEVGELRAWMSNNLFFTGARTPLTDTIQLTPPPTNRERSRFRQATRDALNPGASALRTDPRQSLHSSFVDDTHSADIRSRVIAAITQSVCAAFVLFGFSGEDPWLNAKPPPINADKWHPLASTLLIFLGYLIDTRSLTIAWPLQKRKRLGALLDQALALRTPTLPGLLLARLLGLLRNGGLCTQIGNWASIRLQHTLNDAVRSAHHGRLSWLIKKFPKRYWRTCSVPYYDYLRGDLRFLRSILDLDQELSAHWTRRIGLVIPRIPMYTAIGDASYEGIGAWIPAFHLMWRLSKWDLISLGFPMILFSEPSIYDPEDALHINVLEFLVIIINVWFVLVTCKKIDPTGIRDHIALFLGDNTSSLSWLAHAARTKRPMVRRLARFLQALLTYSFFPLSYTQKHLPGIENGPADTLSRFSLAASWASAMNAHPLELAPLTAFQVPRKLLSTLLVVIQKESPVAMSGKRMTELLTLAATPLPNGWQESATMTSLFPPSPPMTAAPSSKPTPTT